ncbi:MAG: hypothetical protein GEV07_07065 [Streptosporangiales bacterium]|nr:hypothetical protein [Streptosporangiales bacterium]
MKSIDDELPAGLELSDPARTERVGAVLAAAMAELDVTVVVCWDTSEDTVLGHVVARELGAELVLAEEIEGIVSLLQPLPADARVALVAEEFRAHTGLAGLSGVVKHAAGELVAVAAGRGTPELAGTEAAAARLVRPEAG